MASMRGARPPINIACAAKKAPKRAGHYISCCRIHRRQQQHMSFVSKQQPDDRPRAVVVLAVCVQARVCWGLGLPLPKHHCDRSINWPIS